MLKGVHAQIRVISASVTGPVRRANALSDDAQSRKLEAPRPCRDFGLDDMVVQPNERAIDGSSLGIRPDCDMRPSGG